MFAFEALIIIIAGFCFLRIAGKKVIAEMTPLEMVTTLAIGTIIGHAVSENKLWQTIITIAIFISVLILFQFIAMKWNLFQKMLIGKPTIVIKDGVVLKQNLSKLRMTVEQLEMRIRQQGISHLSDIRTATVEVNGQLGYELIPSARPATQGQLDALFQQLRADAAKVQTKSHDVFKQVRKNNN